MPAALAYVLGLITLPALAGLVALALLAASRSNVIAAESTCALCTNLGWREVLLPKRRHRLLVTQWARDTWHDGVLARRHAHRVLWQAMFERHPDMIRDPKAWKLYGLGAPSTSSR